MTNNIYQGGMMTSQWLKQGRVYTREKLSQLFEIKDKTLYTGIFNPKDTSSIWLFITEEKDENSIQYKDFLTGDILFWQGQMRGIKDPMIIEHKIRGLELIVFYRKYKKQFEGSGFEFMGIFEYVRHSGKSPTNFVLVRQNRINQIVLPEEALVSNLVTNNNNCIMTEIRNNIFARRGYHLFRDALIVAYSGQCAISNCTLTDLLEAAYISPKNLTPKNSVSEGLLLRSDLHTLFDCGLIAVESQSLKVVISNRLVGSEYERYNGKRLNLPVFSDDYPSNSALDTHRQIAGV